MTDHTDSTDTAVLPGSQNPINEDEIHTQPPGKKRGGLFGRQKTAPANKKTTSTVVEQTESSSSPGRTGRIIHYSLTALLLIATAGQFTLFSLRTAQLEEDQSALLRRVPAGMAQRLDSLENALADASAQTATLTQLKEQVTSLLAQDPQTLIAPLRAELRKDLEKIEHNLSTLSIRQDTLDTSLNALKQSIQNSMDELKAAPPLSKDKKAAEKVSTPATNTSPIKATSSNAGKTTKSANTGGKKPPFELRGIELRGGVPYAVTTLPDDMSFSSLKLLMAGQSRNGWRLVRTTDSSAIFRAPAGTEITLAIR